MSRRLALAIAVLLLSSVPAFADDMPDAAKTPGAILGTVPDDQVASCLSDKTGTNVQVDDAITIALICTPGYSKCIRNVPQAEKVAVYQSYGLAGNHTGYCDSKQGCEIDHLISLELGGSVCYFFPQTFDLSTPNERLGSRGGARARVRLSEQRRGSAL
jgi:hypothetical protein